jgi:signal transduction histidine kinase
MPCLEQSTLDIGTYHVGQVTDNGHGISEEDQKNMFKRFHRGWAKQSSIPGTGLGLALVKELLEFYAGDIHVDSVVSKGTTFTFWIPSPATHEVKDNETSSIDEQ